MAAPEEPLLCLVTDRHRSAGRPVEEIVEAAVKGGVGLVQLREKDLPAVELFNLATRLRDITAGRAALYINDRVDVAVAVGADGVQLGQQGMPVAAARRVVGDGLKMVSGKE
jgi:thiamine-phosphate pyrophosphorylase